MTQNQNNLLHINALKFAECFQTTVQDMVGISMEVSADNIIESQFQPTHGLVVMIHYTGPIQGEYAVSMDEKVAASIIGAYSDEMSFEDLIANRSDYVGFVKEALNATVGAAITQLNVDFEDLTFLPPVVIFGSLEYPSVPSAKVIANTEFGEIECMFVLNMMNLELGERLQSTLNQLKESAKEASVAKRNMQSLLSSFPAGLVILDSDGCILPGYSTCTNSILGYDKNQLLAGLNLIDCISYKDPDLTKKKELVAWIEVCKSHYKTIGFKDLLDICPLTEQMNNQGKIIHLEWIPLEDDSGVLSSIIAMIEDFTEKRKMESQVASLSKQSEQNVELLSQIINLEPDEISEFVYDSSGLLEEAKKVIHQNKMDRAFVDTLYRTVHTLKGNSGQFKFKSLQSLAADIEKDLAKIRDNSDFDETNLSKIVTGLEEADVYIQKLEDIRSKLGAKQETAEKKISRNRPSVMVPIDEIKSATVKLENLIIAGERLCPNDLLHSQLGIILQAVSEFTTVDVRQYDGLLLSAIERVASRLNKSVKLDISGHVRVDIELFRKIQQSLVHLINNAVDHGLESPKNRLEAGKLASGLVCIHWNVDQNNRLIVSFSDDGVGIDLEKIKAILQEKYDLSQSVINQLSNAELLNYIFMPGFSTRKTVTDTSGRGVGLDVVKTNAEELNGKVEIESTLGKGTEIRFIVPLQSTETSSKVIQ